jgi:hypothetical protein
MMMRHLPKKDRTVIAVAYGILYFTLHFTVFSPGSSFGDALSLLTMVFLAYLVVHYFIHPLFTRAADHFIGLVSPVSFIAASLTYLLSPRDRILVTVLAAYVLVLFILLGIAVSMRNNTSKSAQTICRMVRFITRPDVLYVPIMVIFSAVFAQGNVTVMVFVFVLAVVKPLDRILYFFMVKRARAHMRACMGISTGILDDRTKCAHIK